MSSQSGKSTQADQDKNVVKENGVTSCSVTSPSDTKEGESLISSNERAEDLSTGNDALEGDHREATASDELPSIQPAADEHVKASTCQSLTAVHSPSTLRDAHLEQRQDTPSRPSAPHPQSSPSKKQEALRHPGEQLSKPTRWDTHSWLPLLPASGLICYHGHDVLGFKMEPSHRDRLLQWSEGYMETVAQQRVRWMSFLGCHTGILDDAMRNRLKLLVRLGVPPELRHRVWRLTTGSFAKQRKAAVTYDELLRRYEGVKSPFDDQITKDLKRTLPNHDRYKTDEAQSALGRVLRAYSLWHPTIGYCQGMNFVCAILLLIMAEEDAFWLLAAIVEDVLPGFYHPSLIGVNTDTHTLLDLVAIKLPDVWQSLQTLRLDRESLCSVFVSWFMCLFNQLPSESMLRAWDLLLFEGSKTLFRISLALLKLYSKQLSDLATAVEQGLIPHDTAGHEALKVMRGMPSNAIDSNELIMTAAGGLGSMPKTMLYKLRMHNSRRVLSGGNLEEVFVKQSEALLTLRGREEENTRKCLITSNGGRNVWSGDDSGNVGVWDSQTGCCIKRMQTPSRRRVCSMAVSGLNGEGHVWVGCQGGSICTFDTRTLELWSLLPGHTQDVLAIARVGNSMWTAAGHIVWVWENCETSDPHVSKELNCIGKDILSLLSSSSGAFVFCGSIAGFVVLDAKSGETIIVGSVDEGITDVVEVACPQGHLSDKKVAHRGAEIWCIHGNSVLGCWDAATFSSAQCKHVGKGDVCGLVALPNGEVWSGSSDGRICVWSSKSKRVIRALGSQCEPVSSMVAVANDLLGVLTVWVAHYDGSVSVWIASDLSSESIERANHSRYEWRAQEENIAQIRHASELRGTEEEGARLVQGARTREGSACCVS